MLDHGQSLTKTPGQIERQLEVNLIGPMNITRAILPVMRKQRSGHIISVSSGAGLIGFEFSFAHAASKFGLEGWMDALRPEVAPFGIITTVVNPGFFRTELISEKSMIYAEPSIADYDERRAQQMAWWPAQAGKQPGAPAKLAQALIRIASKAQPPHCFIGGADAIALAEPKVADLHILTPQNLLARTVSPSGDSSLGYSSEVDGSSPHAGHVTNAVP